MNELPGTQSFSIFGLGRVGYLKKVRDGLGTSIPSGPDDDVDNDDDELAQG